MDAKKKERVRAGNEQQTTFLECLILEMPFHRHLLSFTSKIFISTKQLIFGKMSKHKSVNDGRKNMMEILDRALLRN